MPARPGRAHSTSLALADAQRSFLLHLRAENKAPSTITTYGKAIDQFAAYLAANGRPDRIADLERDDTRGYLVSLQEPASDPRPSPTGSARSSSSASGAPRKARFRSRSRPASGLRRCPRNRRPS